MPKVGGKEFPYTPEGMLEAKKEMLKERIKPGPKMLRNRKTLKKSTNRDAVTNSNPIKGY
tara:strand:+ start:473 stop:652 length:180 start_codon:yes stop_codon:yes gene_type:complete